jgi:hypothetical protein
LTTCFSFLLLRWVLYFTWDHRIYSWHALLFSNRDGVNRIISIKPISQPAHPRIMLPNKVNLSINRKTRSHRGARLYFVCAYLTYCWVPFWYPSSVRRCVGFLKGDAGDLLLFCQLRLAALRCFLWRFCFDPIVGSSSCSTAVFVVLFSSLSIVHAFLLVAVVVISVFTRHMRSRSDLRPLSLSSPSVFVVRVVACRAFTSPDCLFPGFLGFR